MPTSKSFLEQKKLPEWVWAFPVATPLLLIVFSYILSPWSWGLMDDFQLLMASGGVIQRIKDIFMMYFSFGELKWTHSLHCAVFYKLFANTPRLFYIFKWAEISGMLFIWGAVAYQLTGRRIMFLLVPAITLSFHYLYDQFFFLSTHETTGLLFLGLAILCLIKIIFNSNNARVCDGFYLWLAAGLFLLLSLGAKETFVACGIALGLAVAALYWMMPSPKGEYLCGGFLLAVLFMVYGLILKEFVCKSYTSEYSFFDLARIFAGFKGWITRDLFNHTPWIMAAVGLWFYRRKDIMPYGVKEKWGILLGCLLYGGFLLVLLPWNTRSYFAGPFGIFFAFTVAIFLVPFLERLRMRWSIILIVSSFLLNLFVAQYALSRELMYHQNTQDLWQWVKGNNGFQDAVRLRRVDCDGVEAAMAIPSFANRFWGLGLEDFRYQLDIKRAFSDNTEYFVHSPRFGARSLDTSRWVTVFYSKYWQVYQRGAR